MCKSARGAPQFSLKNNLCFALSGKSWKCCSSEKKVNCHELVLHVFMSGLYWDWQASYRERVGLAEYDGSVFAVV